MKSNSRVLLFVVCSVTLFVLLSIAGYYYKVSWMPFKRVNLISEIVKPPALPPPPLPVKKPDTTHKADTAVLIKDSVLGASVNKEDFTLYQRPRYITCFNADTMRSSLDSFSWKLHELQTGAKRKIRIAYFGDSMIEGDLLTQTLRKSLQELFGGSGVGFVPVTSPVAKYRITAVAEYSDTWDNENLKEGKNHHLYLSGYSFHTSDGWVQIRDYSITDTVNVQKSLLCGNMPKPVTITVNNKPFILETGKPFNRVALGNDRSKTIKLAVKNEKLPVYGITFESESGVFVDNFAFRGISGIELAKVDSAFLRSIAESNPYDLIIFQYGVNLLFRPNDTDFNWYGENMIPVIRKIRNCFPGSDFIVISTADRAFRYDGEYRSAIGIDSLIRVQAQLAYNTHSLFYNQFASMGGANSIVQWSTMKPAMANKDYVHPNFRGAEVLGRYFFEAIMNEYNKYIHSLK
jgi:lysophospholipase L1-like esterase